MADTNWDSLSPVTEDDPWSALEEIKDDEEEKDPWSSLEEIVEEPEASAEQQPVTSEPELDPAVQQEMADRQSLIDITGVDPYTGKSVNSNPQIMTPGFMDNEENAAEYNRLKERYPEQFKENFEVAGDRPWYQFGFGDRDTETVTGTAADKVFTFSDGRQTIAPQDYEMITTDDGREVIVPPNATEDQIEQAKTSGVFTDQAELPELSRQMYDGFPATPEGREAALELYKAYEAAGETNALGIVTYKGKQVPFPDLALFSAPDLDLEDDISQGIYEGTKGILSTIAALNDLLAAGGDAAANAAIDLAEEISGADIGDVDLTTNAVGAVDDLLPSFPSDSEGILGALAYEGSQLATGGVAGKVTGDKIVGGLSRLSARLGGTRNAAEASQYLLKYAPKTSNVVKALSTEAGMAAALNPEVGTLFIGENALLPLSEGIQADPDSPEYKQLMAKKANLLADAVLGARVVQGGLEATAKGAKLVYLFSGAATIKGILSTGSREEAFVKSVMDRLALAADPAASPERVADLQRQIVKLIEDNEQVIANIDDGEVSVGLSTLAAVQFALKNNDTETARRIVSSAQRIEQGAMGSGYSTNQLATTQGRPARAFEETTTDMYNTRGGAESVDAAGDSLRTSATTPIREAEATLANVEAEATQFADRISSEINSDPFFGGKIDQLNDVDGVSIVLDRNASMDNIVSKLFEANRQMVGKKDELFGKIKGGRLNLRNAEGQQFGEILYERLQVLDKSFLDAGSPKKPGNSQLGELLAVVNNLDEDDAIKFLSNNVTFQDLYTKIRPNLADTISRLERDGSFAATSAMQDLLKIKSLIDDDAVVYLDETGQTKKIASAQEAMDYYKNEFSTYWRDGGVLQDIDRVNNTSAGRLNQAGPMDAARQNVEAGLTDQMRLQGDNILNALMTKEGGGSVDDVVDYVIADAVATLDTQAGKPLNEVDFASVRQKLMQRASLLDGNPATKQAADQVRSFLRQIQRMQQITPELAARIEKAQVAVQRVEEQAYNGALGRFFGQGGKPNPNTEDILFRYFADKQAVGTVNGQPAGDLVELLNRVDAIADPAERELTQKGIEAAFSKFTRERFLIASKEIPNQRGVSEAQIVKELGSVTNLLDRAELIYKNNPENVEGLRTLLQLNGIQAGTRKASTGAGNSITSDKAQATAAVNKLVTLTFGALSRIGARVRSGASGIVNEALDGANSARIAEELLSNPQRFVEIARKVIPKEGDSLTQEQLDLFYAWAVRSQIYNEDSETSQEDFMMAVAEAIASGQDTLNTLENQMMDLLPQ